jgi:hypothetical protein
MATINDHIAHIQTILNAGVPSDDKKLSDEHIYHLMKTVRGRLIYEKQNKNYKISDFNFSYIGCLPLEETTLHDCHCIPPGCFVLASKEVFPKVVSWRNNLMMHVTTVEGETIPQIDLKKYQYNHLRKTQLSKFGWFIHNGRLIIVGDLRLCVVSVKFVAEDPLEVANINLCDTEGNDLGVPCYDPTEDEFPMDIDMVEIMYKLIFEELKIAYSMPQDNENNAKAVEAVQGKE